MRRCEYVCEHYGVPADIGRRLTVNGKPGIITSDIGNYIGVVFDDCKPNDVKPVHPTWKVVYGEMGKPRKPTRSQERYKRYLDSDAPETFGEWLKTGYEW